jgi:hypothetical protein
MSTALMTQTAEERRDNTVEVSFVLGHDLLRAPDSNAEISVVSKREMKPRLERLT